MSTQAAPSFFSPATVYYNGLGGASTTVSIPWVASFDQVPTGATLCVLTQDLRTYKAGLYALMPVNVGGVTTVQWRLGLLFADVGAISADARAMEIVLQSNSSQTFPSGYQVWMNGFPETNLTVTPSVSAIWVIAYLQTANGVVTNVGTFATLSALQTAFPTGALGEIAYVGASAPYTQYGWTGTAWTQSGGGGITTLAAASDYNSNLVVPLASKLSNLGTFATLSALQTAFPTGSLGQTAYVGSAAPYTQYGWSGTAWTVIGGGTPSTTVPNALGTAAVGTSSSFMRADAVIQLPTSGQINAFGIPVNWDPVANTQGLAAGVAPTNNNSYKATQAGTTAYLAADGISSVAAGDEVVFNGTTGHWTLYQLNSIGRTTSAVLKGNGLGGTADTVKGVDYMDAPVLFIPVPLIYPSMNIGASGAVTCGPASSAVVVNLTSGVHTVSVRTPGGQGGTCGYAQIQVALSN